MGALPALVVGAQEALALPIEPLASMPFWEKVFLVCAYRPVVPFLIICYVYCMVYVALNLLQLLPKVRVNNDDVKRELKTEIKSVIREDKTEIELVKIQVDSVKRELKTEMEIVKIDVNSVKKELKTEIGEVKTGMIRLEAKIDKLANSIGGRLELIEGKADYHRQKVDLQLEKFKLQQQNQFQKKHPSPKDDNDDSLSQ